MGRWLRAVAYTGILLGGWGKGEARNSVAERGVGENGDLGGGSPLVRGSRRQL